MSPELIFWLALTTKMALTALFVSIATIIAGKTRRHRGSARGDAARLSRACLRVLGARSRRGFYSASAAASLALNAATAIFLTTYVLIAQRHSLWLSVSVAFVVWLTTTLALSAFHWTASRAFVLNLVVFASCFFIVRPFSHVRMPTTTQAWYDLVIRAGMVTVLVGVIVGFKFQNWRGRKRRACCFPCDLCEHHADLASSHRRPGYGRGAGERHFRPCRVWCSAANAAPNSGATRVRAGSRSRPWRFCCLERRHIWRTQTSSNSCLEDCPGTCDRRLGGLRLLDLLPVDGVHGGEFRHVRQEYSDLNASFQMCASSKPSSCHSVMPPIISLTGRPRLGKPHGRPVGAIAMRSGAVHDHKAVLGIRPERCLADHAMRKIGRAEKVTRGEQRG